MMQQPMMVMTQNMMPTASGTYVPMIETSNPMLQCYMDGCSYLGNGICRWNNSPYMSNKTGGCNRRFCWIHKFEKTRTHHGKRTYSYRSICCPDCALKMEADIEGNE